MTATKTTPAGGSFWKIAAGLAISALFIWLALRNINFAELGRIFLQLNPLWLLVGAAAVLLCYLWRALLWRQLLIRHEHIRVWNLFRIVTIGYFANNLLPLKIGEVIRAWMLSKKEKLPGSTAIATVVLERGTDLFALLFFFTFTMFFVHFDRWLKLSGLAVVGIGVVFAAVVFLNYRFGGHMLEALERPLRKLPGGVGEWLHLQLGKFLEGLKLLESPRQLLAVIGFGLLGWLTWIVVVYICFQALGLKLPFLAAVFLIVVLNFGLMIPSSPGGLGVFEFMVILALTPYGIGKEQALGVGFTFHMLQYILTFFVGWFFTLQMNVSMFKLNSASGAMDLETGE